MTKSRTKVSPAKLARVSALLKAAPSLSNRAIAKVAEVDGKTVARLRRECSAGAELPSEVRTAPLPVDPVKILEAIASDTAAPASARVAAAKELRRVGAESPAPTAPVDVLSARAVAVMNRRGRLN